MDLLIWKYLFTLSLKRNLQRSNKNKNVIQYTYYIYYLLKNICIEISKLLLSRKQLPPHIYKYLLCISRLFDCNRNIVCFEGDDCLRIQLLKVVLSYIIVQILWNRYWRTASCHIHTWPRRMTGQILSTKQFYSFHRSFFWTIWSKYHRGQL